MKDQAELKDLVLRYLDGETSADENATLRARLRDDPEAQRLFARAMRFSGNLATALVEAEAQAATGPLSASLDPLRRRRRLGPQRLVAFGAGMAVAAAVALLLWVAPRPARSPSVARTDAPATAAPPVAAHDRPRSLTPPVATVASIEGEVFRLRGAELSPLRPGDPITSGDGVVTERGSSRLELSDGGQIRLAPGTTVAQMQFEPGGAPALFLAQGRADLTVVTPRPIAMRVATGHLEVKFGSARLEVSATGRLSRVDVHEGRAQVTDRHKGRSSEVEAKQFAVTSEEAALQVRPMPEGGGILYVMGQAATEEDRVVQRRLARFGRTVRVVDEQVMSDLSTTPLHYDLIVISSTVRSSLIDPQLRAAEVPIVTWESWLYDSLGMTGPNDEGLAGYIASEGDLQIKTPSHPLAAGLSGRVRVTTLRGPVAFGVPTPTALWLATVPGEPTRAALFAYRPGDLLVDGQVAPAARVGLFLRDGSPTLMTEDGWALFDAAITWALSTRRP